MTSRAHPSTLILLVSILTCSPTATAQQDADREAKLAQELKELRAEANLLLDAHRYREGARTLERIVAILAEQKQPERDYQVTALRNLGTLLYGHLDRPEDGEPFLVSALEIFEEHGDTSSSYYPFLIEDVGRVKYRLGEYRTAISFFSRALDVRREGGGKSARRSAAALHDLALSHVKLGAFALARELLRKALGVQRIVLDEEQAKTENGKEIDRAEKYLSRTMMTIAGLSLEIGDPSIAASDLEKVVEIRRRLCERRPMDEVFPRLLAKSLEVLSRARAALGEYDEAETLLGEASKTLEESGQETELDKARIAASRGRIRVRRADESKSPALELARAKEDLEAWRQELVPSVHDKRPPPASEDDKTLTHEALRQAQLAVLRGEIEGKKPKDRGAGEAVKAPERSGPYRAPARDWAGWVLSGSWR
jgi:tetratricopeptide (TPR) repeat protein